MTRREKSILTLLLVGALGGCGCGFEHLDVRRQSDATDNPDKFAWETLVDIARPAHNASQDVIWETWASSQDVYVKSGSPVFPSPTHRPLILRAPAPLPDDIEATIPPDGKCEAAADKTCQEVRMNRAAFEYIVANNLWNEKGQIARFDNGTAISFPKQAIEIKAEWKLIGEGDKPRFHWNVDGQGNTLGLVGLHVTTKDLPNWFWATFEQVDNPARCSVNGCKDTFGVDANNKPTSQWRNFLLDHGMGDEWRYYRLTGSQIDFVASTGAPLRVGNSAIEGRSTGLMTCSSCISCHAEARMSRRGFYPSQKWVGAPNPDWFSGKMQMDFVWSLNEAWGTPVASLCACNVVSAP